MAPAAAWERVPTPRETALLWLERLSELSAPESLRLLAALLGAALVAAGLRRAAVAG